MQTVKIGWEIWAFSLVGHSNRLITGRSWVRVPQRPPIFEICWHKWRSPFQLEVLVFVTSSRYKFYKDNNPHNYHLPNCCQQINLLGMRRNCLTCSCRQVGQVTALSRLDRGFEPRWEYHLGIWFAPRHYFSFSVYTVFYSWEIRQVSCMHH